jgi:hypothetical protein
MWPQNSNDLVRERWFIRALILAAAFHILVFFVFVFTLSASPESGRLGFTFWGGVLRKADVQPRQHASSAMELKRFFSMPQMKEDQHRAWSLAVANEKPLALETRSADIMIPVKFIGTRMVITQKEEESPSLKGSEDMPADPHVPLRLPW